jgi:hypothetical protein
MVYILAYTFISNCIFLYLEIKLNTFKVPGHNINSIILKNMHMKWQNFKMILFLCKRNTNFHS